VLCETGCARTLTRGARIIGVAPGRDQELSELAGHLIFLPSLAKRKRANRELARGGRVWSSHEAGGSEMQKSRGAGSS